MSSAPNLPHSLSALLSSKARQGILILYSNLCPSLWLRPQDSICYGHIFPPSFQGSTRSITLQYSKLISRIATKGSELPRTASSQGPAVPHPRPQSLVRLHTDAPLAPYCSLSSMDGRASGCWPCRMKRFFPIMADSLLPGPLGYAASSLFTVRQPPSLPRAWSTCT